MWPWRKRVIVSFDEKQFEGIAALMRTSDILVLESMAKLHRRIINMSAQLDALKAEVEETRSVAASAVALINGLAQQILDAKDDPAAIEALVADLDQSNAALAAAVEANTAPAPVADPAPEEAPAEPEADPTPPSE